MGNVAYNPFVLHDGSRGAILGMSTDKVTFVTAVALDNLQIHNGDTDSMRMTAIKKNTIVRGRVWVLDSNGNTQIMKAQQRVEIPIPEPGMLPTDDHAWCVHFCGIMCSVGMSFLCGFVCATVSGPAAPICIMVCATFSYAYCTNCDWYCRVNGF